MGGVITLLVVVLEPQKRRFGSDDFHFKTGDFQIPNVSFRKYKLATSHYFPNRIHGTGIFTHIWA